jgi:hypothetical protein
MEQFAITVAETARLSVTVAAVALTASAIQVDAMAKRNKEILFMINTFNSLSFYKNHYLTIVFMKYALQHIVE